ncbi:Ribosomal RNA small subunit methyltransferase E [Labilithrix luteola]|uniref:Ribosomal RNA small subunit methyltransferase E n=1 Tax=Labilithrix luteola TaxID=1391654 RepID=A0A0K1Q115_9BACT|nr:16S rRNA (uracil(1498)-N(3))-methyltransferase [Labilithrix luteola]AKU99316.1 Ribosomal RNA small subunit methyltransferase E [Labilithrix luteola]
MAIRAPIVKLTAGRMTLTHETSHYLCRVLRLRAGDAFLAFDPEALLEADATITVASDSAAEITVSETRGAKVVADVPLVLVYALAKGDKVDAVVRDATELGATRVVVARTERAIVKADEAKAANKLDRFRRVAEQAARQSGRADPPKIEGVYDFAAALEAAKSDTQARYCLDVRGTVELGALLPAAITTRSGIAFAIGPEGGLTDREVEAARAHGFEIVTLGRFVLRTETVAAAVLGAVRVLSR